MKITAADFRKRLGAEVASILGRQCAYKKTAAQISWEAPAGQNVIALSGSNKFSPYIHVAFYFGVNYTVVRNLEKRLGWNQFPSHIQQYSVNRRSFESLPFRDPSTWSVDITDPPPALAEEIVTAIHGMAMPMLSRFGSIEAARDALAANDPWCFGGPPFWRNLLRIDLALNQLEQFTEWMSCLSDFDRAQAAEEIAHARAVLK